MFKRLFRTKTFWAAVAAILGAAEQVAVGAMPWTQGLQIALPALLALLLRDGIAKQQPGQEPAPPSELPDAPGLPKQRRAPERRVTR